VPGNNTSIKLQLWDQMLNSVVIHRKDPDAVVAARQLLQAALGQSKGKKYNVAILFLCDWIDPPLLSRASMERLACCELTGSRTVGILAANRSYE
jgi:hypothetical protein